jgi:hypothetical protein
VPAGSPDGGQWTEGQAAYEAGKREGAKYDNDLRKFDAAARHGDAEYPSHAETPANPKTLFWEAGFRGLDVPQKVQAERIGEVPKEGRSFNFREQQFEPGVSVLNVVGQKPTDNGTYEKFNPGKKVVVEGYLHYKTGADGEPIIVGAKKVKDL